VIPVSHCINCGKLASLGQDGLCLQCRYARSTPPNPVPIAAPSPEQWPFRCPLCDGNGTLPLLPHSTGQYRTTCRACDGKGIVWGPPK
jgi:hypothetical protein